MSTSHPAYLQLFMLGWLFLGWSFASAKSPNVVLILIDDLSHYGVTAYGSNTVRARDGEFGDTKISTPSIDALAADGLRCDNAFAYPLCESTRIALMSGQLNCRNLLRPKSQHASDITFGDLFDRAGYATGIFGKWKQSRGTSDIPAKDYIYEFGWDEFCCFDVVDEGPRYINPNLVINGEVHKYAGRRDVDPQTGRRWYGPDICNRHALDFIERHKHESFFLYYPMLLVHDEHTPTPDTKPHELFDEFPERKHVAGSFTGDDRRFFPDMLAYMDKLIGQVVDKLEQHDLRRDTLVIVMGDNGTKETFLHILSDGSVYPGAKGSTRDGGLHVPLVLSQPGTVPSGDGGHPRTYSGLVDVVDILPTICEAAGVEVVPPAGIDGISFWSQVLGDPTEHRSVIYTWYNANYYATDLSHLLRYAFDKKFKRYATDADFPAGRFFDLQKDPLERAGDREVRVNWGHIRRSGLDVGELADDQQAAYQRLGNVIEKREHVPVTGIRLASPGERLGIGDSVQLNYQIEPSNATRRNIIWKSSNPSVLTVDKFGLVTARESGEATVTVAPWDSQFPLAAGPISEPEHSGIKGILEFQVR